MLRVAGILPLEAAALPVVLILGVLPVQGADSEPEIPPSKHTKKTPAEHSDPITKTDNGLWSLGHIHKLTAHLSNERFAVRENATRELGRAPPSWLHRIKNLALEADDSETRHRLLEAGRSIFVQKIVEHLAEWRIGRGFLGIQWTISSDPPGIRTIKVLSGTAAEKAGLKDGDIITAIDATEFENGFGHQDAMDLWRNMASGDPMKLTVKRGDEADKVLHAVIGRMPRPPEESRIADQRKRQKLWAAYLDGSIAIPKHVLSPAKPDSGTSPKKALGPRPKPDSQSPHPLQSWPKGYESSGIQGQKK